MYPHLLKLLNDDDDGDDLQDCSIRVSNKPNLCGWEYSRLISATIRGYIKKGTEQFLLKEGICLRITVQTLLKIIEREKTIRQGVDLDAIPLLMFMLEFLKGRIDDQISSIVLTALKTLEDKDTKHDARNLLMQLICTALWYNADLTLSLFSANLGFILDQIELATKQQLRL